MREDFKKKLTSEQYNILRKKGTETPGTRKLLYNKKKGKYMCAACGNILFSSAHKFDSGTGWPSFYELAKRGSVELQKDFSHGIIRIEACCSKVGSHLVHLYKDS